MAVETDRPPSVPNTTTLPTSTKEPPTSSPSPATTTDAGAATLSVKETTSTTKANASQPMTSTSSSSSNPSLRDVTTSATPSASPYGTRSRNRTTASRPNYAEDKETEMDYEYTSKNPTTAETQNADPGRISGVSTRRASAVAIGAATVIAANGSSISAASKEHIPGTSTFSANLSTNTASSQSKKRKASGPAGASGLNATTASTDGSPTLTRKASLAAASAGGSRDSNMLSFENCQGYLKNGKLKADDGTVLAINDHVYLVCEPPGEPYYLARIMEFLHIDNEPSLPIDSLRVNWYYRPRDIQRKVNDTRVVFASMHSDTCPLTSLRGKCHIRHKSEIDDIDEYRKSKDRFWYEKMFDRYIHRYYEVIPTSQVINVPAKVKKVLDERWKFVIVEIGRGKELTSDVKSCKRCERYAATPDSVECAVCHSTYHMNCVRPPLLKKPSRGFAWACGPCSRAQERKLEARNTPLMGDLAADPDEEELYDDDEEDAPSPGGTTGGTNSSRSQEHDPIHPATAEQIAHAKLWPYRYLGVHCKVEDALDYDDRIYPRASSRLGPRHQANVNVWHGHPVELVKPADIKKKYVKGGGHKKDAKLSKETIAALEADKIAKEKRPKWVMDEPPGYVRRGEDRENDDPENTATLMFCIPEVYEVAELSKKPDPKADIEAKLQTIQEREAIVDDYMAKAKGLAKIIGVEDFSTNFLDKALEILSKNKFDVEVSLKQLRTINKRKDLKEPELRPDELKRFEEGVSKFGSELHSVTKFVKTQKEADIVRFYYMWKKTDRGRKIWGNYEGRKGKKEAKRADHNTGKLVDDVADDYDDSAFDDRKAADKKKGFECKFCLTRSSKQWRRAPGVAPGTTISADTNGKGGSKDKGIQLVVALCRRCAELWRRYGIQWENYEEIAKKVAQGGGRAWKRRIDEELLKEYTVQNESVAVGTSTPTATGSSATGSAVIAASLTAQPSLEPPKKKAKTTTENSSAHSTPGASTNPSTATNGVKKKVVEKPPPPPAVPEIPKPKVLPCGVCKKMEPMGDQLLSCRECRMSVHRDCYGIGEARSASKWVCDMCTNDKNPQISTQYECVLCPVYSTEHEFVDPPKISHKKKTDKEREKERAEREAAVAAAEYYRKKQEEMNRPQNPREPLKRTAGNNWVHVLCAVWTTEIKFGNAKALEPCEGIGTIPLSKINQVCKLCKTSKGTCVSCHHCHATVHVTCAHKAGYTLGFDIAPVKGSRRDIISTVTLGNESGSMTPAVWCKDHTVKTIVHQINELADGTGPNALQLYVRNYKQADLTLTGTVRKANLVNLSTKAITQGSAGTPGNRRASGISITGNATVTSPQSVEGSGIIRVEDVSGTELAKKICVTCGIDVSPKWWKTRSKTSLDETNKASISNGHQQHTPNGTVLNGDSQNTQPQTTQPQLGSSASPTNGEILNSPAAIAAAALIVDPVVSHVEKTVPSFQCHKCYWKKLHREPSPPPAVQPSAPPTVPTAVAPPVQLTWPATPPLPPPGPFPNWSHPLAAPQNVPPSLHFGETATSHQLNGVPMSTQLNGAARATRPPPIQTGVPTPYPISRPSLQVNGPSQSHPVSVPPQPHHPTSPHTARQLNGSAPHQLNGTLPPQSLNGPSTSHNILDRPRSQHSASSNHAQLVSIGPHHSRVSDGSFALPPPPPPPPALSQPLYGVPQGSPRHGMMNERPQTPQGPMPAASANGVRPIGDGRASGGASASPSLRNLLS